MSRITAPLCATVLALGLTTAARADAVTFTCDPISFPDGTDGIAVVTITFRAHSSDVVVEYYTPGYASYLGSYEELGSEHAPGNKDEAVHFAAHHYHDRTVRTTPESGG